MFVICKEKVSGLPKWYTKIVELLSREKIYTLIALGSRLCGHRPVGILP